MLLNRRFKSAMLSQSREAVADFSKVVELKPDYWRAWYSRGSAHGELQQWEKAIGDYSKAAELNGTAVSVWPGYALLHLAIDDRDGYRDVCGRMLAQLRRSTSGRTRSSVVWTCCLAPNAVDDLALLVGWGEQAVESNPANQANLATLGAILYRGGQFERAIETLEKAIDADDEGRIAGQWLLLAMAHHRLGHAEEAGKWMAKAVVWIDEANQERPEATDAQSPSGANGEDATVSLSWRQRLALQILRREAESVLAGAASSTSTQETGETADAESEEENTTSEEDER